MVTEVKIFGIRIRYKRNTGFERKQCSEKCIRTHNPTKLLLGGTCYMRISDGIWIDNSLLKVIAL